MSTTYLEPYIYLPERKVWGTATDLAIEDLSIELTTDYLAMLSDGSDDHGTRCAICESEGACRTWVIETANDADVPAQWLAEQVIDGAVNRYTPIADIVWRYLPF